MSDTNIPVDVVREPGSFYVVDGVEHEQCGVYKLERFFRGHPIREQRPTPVGSRGGGPWQEERLSALGDQVTVAVRDGITSTTRWAGGSNVMSSDPNIDFSAALREQVDGTSSHVSPTLEERVEDARVDLAIYPRSGEIIKDKLLNPDEYGIVGHVSVQDGLTFGGEPEPVPLEEVDPRTLRTDEERLAYVAAVKADNEAFFANDPGWQQHRDQEQAQVEELHAHRQYRLDIEGLVALDQRWQQDEDSETLAQHWASMSEQARTAAFEQGLIDADEAADLEQVSAAQAQVAENSRAIDALERHVAANVARADADLAELTADWDPSESRARLEAADALMLAHGVDFDQLKQSNPAVALMHLRAADATLREHEHVQRTRTLHERILSHDPTIAAGYEINGQPVLKRELPPTRANPDRVATRAEAPRRATPADIANGVAAQIAKQQAITAEISRAYHEGTDAVVRHRLEQLERQATSRGLVRR